MIDLPSRETLLADSLISPASPVVPLFAAILIIGLPELSIRIFPELSFENMSSVVIVACVVIIAPFSIVIVLPLRLISPPLPLPLVSVMMATGPETERDLSALRLMEPPLLAWMPSPLIVISPPSRVIEPPLAVIVPLEITVSSGPPASRISWPSFTTNTPALFSVAGVEPNCRPGTISLVRTGASWGSMALNFSLLKSSASAVLALKAPPTSIRAFGPKTMPLGLIR